MSRGPIQRTPPELRPYRERTPEGSVGSGLARAFIATERAFNRQVVVKVLSPALRAGLRAGGRGLMS